MLLQEMRIARPCRHIPAIADHRKGELKFPPQGVDHVFPVWFHQHYESRGPIPMQGMPRTLLVVRLIPRDLGPALPMLAGCAMQSVSIRLCAW